MAASPGVRRSTANGSGLRIAAALAAIYMIWGSTYLAIRFAIETMPPFLMAAVRFLIAGTALYAWRRIRGDARPRRRQWAIAAVPAALMLLLGHGTVSWAELTVPSGLAALLVATVTLWVVLIDWWRQRRRPHLSVFVGLALGLLGVATLFGPADLLGGGAVDPAGAIAILVGTVGWAIGSLYVSRADLPESAMLTTSMQMICGGVQLFALSIVAGDWRSLRLDLVSTRSVVALSYLIVFGSIIAYSAYMYLLRAASPARATTYAYVNPIVAVLLGWALAGEALGPRVITSSVLVVAAVILILRERSQHEDER